MHTVTLRGAEPPLSPRIFAKRLRPPEGRVAPGEVVAVLSASGEFVGRAFYSPRSVIGARILDREEKGPPIDREWFSGRIGAAARIRREILRLDEVTDAYRLVHAEGDGLSGLVVDRYGPIAVVEPGCRGMFEHLDSIERAVREAVPVERVVVRADPEVERIEGFRAFDRRAAEARTTIAEHGLEFEVDCLGGHKTGFFIDQRDSRQRLRRLARGRTVLDLCCYTGGFSLAAAAGGARSVLGVDLDEQAVEMARGNARRNRLAVEFVHEDAFDALRSGRRAGVVVLDPPKLAATPRDLPRARRKSVDMNALALAAVEPSGLLFTFSCTGLFSADDFLGQVREAARRAGRTARVLESVAQPPDHPVALDCPEGRYLHGLLLHLS